MRPHQVVDHADRTASVQSMRLEPRYLPDSLSQPFALDHAQMLQVAPGGCGRFGSRRRRAGAAWVASGAVLLHFGRCLWYMRVFYVLCGFCDGWLQSCGIAGRSASQWIALGDCSPGAFHSLVCIFE